MNKNLKIFILSIFLIPLIPTYLLWNKSLKEFAIILVATFWILGLNCIIFKKFANLMKNFTNKVFSFIGKYIAIIVLFFGYIFVVIPTSLIMKLTKRDRLKLSKQNISTYWINTDNKTLDYEREF